MKRGGNLQRKTEMPRGKPLESRTALSRGKPLRQVSERWQQEPKRPAPRGPSGFPERIRQQALARDGGHCLACGDDRGLDVHHRRIKGMGGSKASHTDCPCNAATLCRICHAWAHSARREAEAEGFVVPRATILPGSVSVMVHGAGGGGSALFPTCDGEWSTAAPLAVSA